MIKFKCASKKAKQEYEAKVQSYLKRNGIAITHSIYASSLHLFGLADKDVERILPKPFPIASWIDEKKILKQFLCMLKYLGCENAYIKDEKIFFDLESYQNEVESYLSKNGEFLLDKLSYFCSKNPRISYTDIQEVLGYDYPKIIKSTTADKSVCAIVFLKQTGMLFRFDNTAIYMP